MSIISIHNGRPGECRGDVHYELSHAIRLETCVWTFVSCNFHHPFTFRTIQTVNESSLIAFPHPGCTSPDLVTRIHYDAYPIPLANIKKCNHAASDYDGVPARPGLCIWSIYHSTGSWGNLPLLPSTFCKICL